MPPSAASRSSAAIAAGAMRRCLWLQNKPRSVWQAIAARAAGCCTRLERTSPSVASLSSVAAAACAAYCCRFGCGAHHPAASLPQRPLPLSPPCCRTQLKRVRRHSCSAAAHSALGSTACQGGIAARAPHCCARLKFTPPLAASLGAATLPLAPLLPHSAVAHAALRRCPAQLPCYLCPCCCLQLQFAPPLAAQLRVAALPLAPTLQRSAARCPRRHHPAWRPCRSHPTLLHSAVWSLSCVVTRAIRSVGAPGTCGSPREGRATSAPRVHCAVRPVAARSLEPRARLAPRGSATRRAKRAPPRPPPPHALCASCRAACGCTVT